MSSVACSMKCAVFGFTTLAFVTQVGSAPLISKRSVNKEQKQPPPCDVFDFYDGGTELCEPCRDICEDAVYWNTVQQCQTDCPAYWQKMQCREDEYYDQHTATCTACYDLCHNSHIRGTTDQCHTYCPGYEKDEDNLAQPGFSTQQSPRKKDPQIHNPDSPTTESLDLIWIIAVAAVVVIVFPTATVIIYFCFFRRNQPQELQVKYTPGTSDAADSGSDGTCTPCTPLNRPQQETQPGMLSELAVN